MNKKKIFRVLDANFNRAREGMRVVEDIMRYYYQNESIYKKIKKLRHRLSSVMLKFYNEMIKERDILKDPGFKLKERGKRKNVVEILKFNFLRIEEALRVIEEFSKMEKENFSEQIKKIRYRIYEIEKEV